MSNLNRGIDSNKKRYGQLVRRVRESMGLTQEEFASKYGKVKSTISLYESGERIPPTDMLFELLELDGQITFYETDCPTCGGTGIITTTKLERPT